MKMDKRMKMEIWHEVLQGVGPMRIEQGYRSVDDDGPATLRVTDRLEAFKEETDAGGLHSRGTAEVRVSGGIFAEPDSEKGKALKLRVGETNDGFKDDAAMARSRALQEAVSQGVRQAQLLHQQQLQAQPQQTSVVRWERFLPQRQLRVLLVEDDDSTRHVVSALLRNCSYEVTSAATGSLAWELLMDQTKHVDLVLTEVVMPGVSGIGLLARIMSHEALKHIPVIMMSSHDSMGVVFKCLSKGAVDFLVKPVRKNELKNLWQHIWRRCHSSSGSWSGSGSRTQKVARPDGVDDVNNSGSNDESDNTSSELNIGGGSDNGSGTQSSWTKKAVEVESSHQGTNWDLRGLNAGSIMHSPNQAKNGSVLGAEHHEGKGVDIALAPDVKLATSIVAAAEPTFHIEKGQLESTHGMPGTTAASVRNGGGSEEGARSGLSQGNAQRAIDLISAISSKEQDSDEEQQADSEDADDLLEKHASNSPSSKDKNLSDSSSPSLLELSLKRPRQVEDDREQEGRGGLRHSYSSAFSRYNTSGNHKPLPAGTLPANIHTPPVGRGGHALVQGSSIGSSHPSSIPFTSQMERVAFPKGGTDDEAMVLPSLKGILHANSNQDKSLSHAFPSGKHGVAACFAKEEAMPLPSITGSGMQMPLPLSPGMPGTFGSSKEPFFSGHAHAPHWESSTPGAEIVEVKDCCVSYEHSQGHLYSHTNQNPQFHHHSHHHSHHHHHHHHIQHHYHHHRQDQLQQMPMTPQQEDQTVTNVGDGAPRCGSSNMGKGPEGNNGQSGSSNGYGSNGNGAGSLNGSATGSNNGSNGGQAAVAQPGGGNGDNGVQLGAGNGLTVTHGVLLGPNQGCFARREAALTKFRQKRKERCFEKKVRYQSRKRLAEQRPRVRGQFVRQSVYESTIWEPE